jgi:hypothetical protein
MGNPEIPTLVNVLQDRLNSLKHENGEIVDEEQRHLDSGSAERVYWHHGYASALKDILRILRGAGSVN